MCLRLSSRFFVGSSDGSSAVLRPLRWKLISLLLVGVCLILTGCSNPLHDFFARTPDLYIPDGKCAEVREPVTIKTWSHVDGKPVKSHFHAYPGSNIGPGRPSSSVPPIKESEIK